MRAYIAISFAERELLQPALEAMKAVLEHYNITPFVFCEQYLFATDDEQAMMQQAFADIDASDLLLAETSYKAIGIGVEAGYAKGLGLPVIYLRQQDASHSTTVSGASDYHIIYTDVADMQEQLQQVIAGFKLAIT